MENKSYDMNTLIKESTDTLKALENKTVDQLLESAMEDYHNGVGLVVSSYEKLRTIRTIAHLIEESGAGKKHEECFTHFEVPTRPADKIMYLRSGLMPLIKDLGNYEFCLDHLVHLMGVMNEQTKKIDDITRGL